MSGRIPVLISAVFFVLLGFHDSVSLDSKVYQPEDVCLQNYKKSVEKICKSPPKGFSGTCTFKDKRYIYTYAFLYSKPCGSKTEKCSAYAARAVELADVKFISKASCSLKPTKKDKDACESDLSELEELIKKLEDLCIFVPRNSCKYYARQAWEEMPYPLPCAGTTEECESCVDVWVQTFGENGTSVCPYYQDTCANPALMVTMQGLAGECCPYIPRDHQ